MAVAEALVLLAIGLLCGVVSTVFDVLVLASASFLSHFSLWVLLNALLAVHVDSRTKAVWWSAPFNLGYIEGYFITTVASFESYAKSLMVPLAGIALIAPFLVLTLWTARKERNSAYGRVLSALVVACTLAASYVLNQRLGIYDAVVCTLLGLVLLLFPARRLKIERAPRGVTPGEKAKDPAAPRTDAFAGVQAEQAPVKGEPTAKAKDDGGATNTEQKQGRRTLRPTKRTGRGARQEAKEKVPRRRRGERGEEERARKERRRIAAQRRAQRQDGDARDSRPSGMATLGNARMARRSSRSA